MHESPVLIYHIFRTVQKYLSEGKGSLDNITDVPKSAHFAYNGLKNDSLRRSMKRISDEIQSNMYTVNDFIVYMIYSRLVSPYKNKPDLGINSKTVREMKKAMSSNRFNEDLKFIREFAADLDYDHVTDLFVEKADINEENKIQGCVFSVLVKKRIVSPVTYLFFYIRLTPEQKNIIFTDDNLIVFNREIEAISLFFKGVGKCQSRKTV